MAQQRPAIIEKYPRTQHDLLYNIHLILFNQYNMNAPVITEFDYGNQTDDLLGNIYVLLKGTVPGFLPAGTASYNIPANAIVDKFIVLAPTEIDFTIGTTPGGTEILDGCDVNVRRVITIDIDGGAAGLTIYFGGVLPDTVIKPFIR